MAKMYCVCLLKPDITGVRFRRIAIKRYVFDKAECSDVRYISWLRVSEKWLESRPRAGQ